MRHGSLFSGIGGFDLAAEWMGWENVFHCEINEFGRKVLHYHFPNSISYEDITKTDFTIHRGHIDVLSGGFPCQPYSYAGKRLGKEDERHLWPQMLRAIKEIAPSWIVGENVYGLVNWSNGLVFHEIQADLEAQGYEVFPILCPAVSVNAPHVRQRIFFIAKNTNDNGRGSEKRQEESREWEQRNISAGNNEWVSTDNDEIRSSSDSELNAKRPDNRTDGEEAGAIRRNEESNVLGTFCGDGDAANTNCEVLESGNGQRETGRRANEKVRTEPFGRPGDWSTFPTVTPICVRNDGVSYGLDSITFPKWRNESIKAAGNAVVPQLVLQFFKTIAEYERIATSDKNQKEA